MNTWLDVTYWFCQDIIAKGYQEVPWRAANMTIPARVFEKGARVVVVVRPGIRVDPRRGPIGQQVANYFGRLRRILEKLMQRHRVTDIVFQGGGSVPLSEDLKEWCLTNGIRIHLVVETKDGLAGDIHEQEAW